MTAKHALRRSGAAGLCVALLATAGAHADPAASPTQTWGVDGEVSAVALSGTTAFLGGRFHNIGRNTGGFGLVDPAGGILRASSPPVIGVVNVAIADGAGGWYLGGAFTHVGGLPRKNLAHVLADGSTDPKWGPRTDRSVAALRRSGGVVYVGGSFATVNGGVPRNGLAAFDATTGAVTPFAPPVAGLSDVRTLAILGTSAAPTIIAGGSFSIASPVRKNLAAFDKNGAVTGFAPNPDGPVAALATRVTPVSNTIYAAGSFANAGGQPRSGLAAFENAASAPTAWDPDFSNEAESITVSGATVYVGGVRTVRAFAATGAGVATAFNAKIQGTGISDLDTIRSLTVLKGRLYVGGIFAGAGEPPAPRLGLAAFDATSGAVLGWDPAAGNPPIATTVASDGSSVAIGGFFTILNAVEVPGVAAIDLRTGRPPAGFSPSCAACGEVNALAVSGSTLYAASGNRILSLNTTTGAARSFAPVFDDPVRALATDGSTIYAGGDFTTANGAPRERLAYLRDVPGTAGALLAAAPDVDGVVNALARGGDTLYVGGAFTHVNGPTVRHNLAALSSATGAAKAFNPDLDGPVSALALDGSTLYAGGEFTHVNGAIVRNRLAGFDTASGGATAFDPNPSHAVLALAAADSTVFAGGIFISVNGATPRGGLAALDPGTGTARAFAPDPRVSIVSAVAASREALVIGGRFTSVSSPPTAASHFAAFALPPAPPAATPSDPSGLVAPVTDGGTPGTSSLPPRMRLDRFTMRPASFRAAGRGGSVTKPRTSRRARVGTKVSYGLSGDAAVRFTVLRRGAGRRVNGRCRKRTSRNRRGRRCDLRLKGSVGQRGKQGRNTFRFSGRLQRRQLRPGSYLLVAVATDAGGNKSTPKRARFRIVKR